MAGRPPGMENKNKRFKAALLRYADADPSRLDALAEKLWATAMEGDTQAVREIADRLDGKVAQPIGGSDDLPPIGITQIDRKIIDVSPGNPDGTNLPAPPGPGEI